MLNLLYIQVQSHNLIWRLYSLCLHCVLDCHQIFQINHERVSKVFLSHDVKPATQHYLLDKHWGRIESSKWVNYKRVQCSGVYCTFGNGREIAEEHDNTCLILLHLKIFSKLTTSYFHVCWSFRRKPKKETHRHRVIFCPGWFHL